MRPSLAFIALLLMSAPAMAQSGPPGGGGQGGPGGAGGGFGGFERGPRPPKPPKPLKRATFDKAVTTLFGKGDTNRDGTVTLAELRAAIDAKRDKVIADRFERIDSDGNGSIGKNEFFAWQRGLGTVAFEEGAARKDTEIVPAFIEPDLDDDEDGMALRRLIEPLGATLLAKANTNYDSGMTLAEFLAYQGARFDAADSNGDGAISIDEMRPDRGPGGDRGRGPPPGGPGVAPPGRRN